MNNNPPDIYEDFVPNPEIQAAMDDEISHVPRANREMQNRLDASTNTPEITGGDVDAEWEKAENDGAETFAGHNPTPDQSDVEANGRAFGVNFEDNQEMDLLEQMRQRDRDRFELDESSKGEGDMI